MSEKDDIHIKVSIRESAVVYKRCMNIILNYTLTSCIMNTEIIKQGMRQCLNRLNENYYDWKYVALSLTSRAMSGATDVEEKLFGTA